MQERRTGQFKEFPRSSLKPSFNTSPQQPTSLRTSLLSLANLRCPTLEICVLLLQNTVLVPMIPSIVSAPTDTWRVLRQCISFYSAVFRNHHSRNHDPSFFVFCVTLALSSFSCAVCCRAFLAEVNKGWKTVSRVDEGPYRVHGNRVADVHVRAQPLHL